MCIHWPYHLHCNSNGASQGSSKDSCHTRLRSHNLHQTTIILIVRPSENIACLYITTPLAETHSLQCSICGPLPERTQLRLKQVLFPPADPNHGTLHPFQVPNYKSRKPWSKPLKVVLGPACRQAKPPGVGKPLGNVVEFGLGRSRGFGDRRALIWNPLTYVSSVHGQLRSGKPSIEPAAPKLCPCTASRAHLQVTQWGTRTRSGFLQLHRSLHWGFRSTLVRPPPCSQSRPED